MVFICESLNTITASSVMDMVGLPARHTHAVGLALSLLSESSLSGQQNKDVPVLPWLESCD